jgi:hypothetical protein
MPGTDDLDFDRFAWHDDPLYGFALELGDPADGDWRSDLVLDIDHIVEWVRSGASFRFRVAPATLVFHGASELRIDLDWGLHGWQVAPALPTIDRIERERIPAAAQRVHLDRPYYAWRIALSFPAGGSISFGALGCELALRAEPVLYDQQCVPAPLRKRRA